MNGWNMIIQNETIIMDFNYVVNGLIRRLSKIYYLLYLDIHISREGNGKGAHCFPCDEMVISISRNELLKFCARFIIEERSEIRKKQHDFKSVHFECRMVLFYMIWEKSRL